VSIFSNIISEGLHHEETLKIKVVSESSRTVTIASASVKEDERGGQGHTSASLIALACHVAPLCEQALLLHECSFDLIFFLLSAMDGKIEQHVCIKFCVKLGKSATKTLEMLPESFGEHSLRQRFLNDIHVSRPIECQLKMTNVSG
jgi:hypothetical protein